MSQMRRWEIACVVTFIFSFALPILIGFPQGLVGVLPFAYCYWKMFAQIDIDCAAEQAKHRHEIDVIMGRLPQQ